MRISGVKEGNYGWHFYLACVFQGRSRSTAQRREPQTGSYMYSVPLRTAAQFRFWIWGIQPRGQRVTPSRLCSDCTCNGQSVISYISYSAWVCSIQGWKRLDERLRFGEADGAKVRDSTRNDMGFCLTSSQLPWRVICVNFQPLGFSALPTVNNKNVVRWG
jgi:hypothetical protein